MMSPFNRPPTVAILRLSGVIGAMGPIRNGLSLEGTERLIERAFKLKRLKAVALAVNSPGGSPVQSALIAGRIRQLADETETPVIAFAEDVAASGGYWLACAGDEIYADASSVVGSIGVVSGGFGFVDAIAKLGIERRLRTSGNKKAMLDPFSPQNPEHLEHLKALQSDIHESFKGHVRSRRGDKLKGEEDELFSGAFWTGGKGVELGLIDALGDLRTVMREKFGENVRFVPVTGRKGWLRRKLGGQTLDNLPGAALAAVEDRLMWKRFGL